MKEKLLKNTILTFIVLFVFTLSIGAVEKKRDIQATSSSSKSEQLNSEKPESLATKATKLSFKEKFKLVRKIKKEMHKAGRNKSNVPMIVLYILAVLLPPVAVGLYTNWGEPTLWNLLFTLLMWIPGIVHAFYILLR